jgi:hypothetical protein
MPADGATSCRHRVRPESVVFVCVRGSNGPIVYKSGVDCRQVNPNQDERAKPALRVTEPDSGSHG